MASLLRRWLPIGISVAPLAAREDHVELQEVLATDVALPELAYIIIRFVNPALPIVLDLQSAL